MSLTYSYYDLEWLYDKEYLKVELIEYVNLMGGE
jgi:hypothetical protein